jgi:beta-1,4-N-acetylglucosaminyltransferase
VKIVYVESIARVETLSLSGRLLYRTADHFLVQWPQLQAKYPRAQFVGRLC